MGPQNGNFDYTVVQLGGTVSPACTVFAVCGREGSVGWILRGWRRADPNAA
jgi:hypothetical protein